MSCCAWKPLEKAQARRPSRAEREAAVDTIRSAAAETLAEIDCIVDRFGGERLAATPDALGSIPVETTPAGVSALAASEHVKAILEDQPISLLSKPKPPS